MPIILDGTTGITTPGITNTGTFVFQGPVQVPAGSAATASITTAAGANTGIFFPSSSSVAITTAGTQRFVVNSSGNVGVGTTPSEWSIFRTVQIGPNGGSINASTGANDELIQIISNAYYDGSNYRRVVAANSMRYVMNDGQHIWETATSSSVGSTVNFTSGMTLDPSSNLLINTSTQVGRLTVNTLDSGAVPTVIAMRNPGTANNTGVRLSFRGNLNTSAEADYAYIDMVATDTTARYGAIALLTSDGAGPAERMRINRSGDVGIGTTTPNHRLQVTTATSASIAISTSTASSSTATLFLSVANDFSGTSQAYVRCIGPGNSGISTLTFGTAGSSGDTTATERARITSDGYLLVGTTAFTQSGNRAFAAHWSYTGSGGEGGCEFRNTSTSSSSDPNPCLILQKGSTTTTSSQRFIQFYANTTGQPMGGIVGNGAENVQFATLSDVRQKTNIQSISGSLKKILALNPVSFDWIYNNEHVNAGFVAQDVEQVFPEFVIENFSNSGNEPRKGLTGGMTGGIIPHLVKAIQELKAELDALKGSN